MFYISTKKIQFQKSLKTWKKVFFYQNECSFKYDQLYRAYRLLSTYERSKQSASFPRQNSIFLNLILLSFNILNLISSFWIFTFPTTYESIIIAAPQFTAIITTWCELKTIFNKHSESSKFNNQIMFRLVTDHVDTQFGHILDSNFLNIKSLMNHADKF